MKRPHVMRSLAAAVLLGLFAATTAFAPGAIAQGNSPVRINEVQTSNVTTLTDGTGATPDWIELLNTSAQAIDLSGWGLSDRVQQPSLWQFPVGTTIAANSTLLIFASGSGASVGGELHANFSLSADGEFVGLYNQAGILVSSFDPIPVIPADASWGLSPNGALNLFTAPTPNAPNGTGTFGLAPDVAATPGRGFYSAPIQVVLQASAGDSIRYTTDRTEPTATTGLVYSAPIPVSSSTVIRAIVARPGWTSPKPVTHTYIFAGDEGAGLVADGIESLPAISLTAQTSTFFEGVNVPVAVEMIFPDASPGFQVDAGIKEVGGHSVTYPKDSYRLSFGSAWGESSLDFPVFDGADNSTVSATTSFKRLTLRMGNHDGGWWGDRWNPRSFLRSRWHDETMLDLGHTDTHGRFVSVYLNGAYWGQYHLREFFDDHFMAAYHGGVNDDYIGVNGGEIAMGSGGSWDAFVNSTSSWTALSQIVDPVNFVDWMLISEYGGNTWDLNADRNWRAAGPAEVGTTTTGYIFTSSDPDISLVDPTTQTDFPGPVGAWADLIAEGHPDFLTLVRDRVQEHFYDDGAMTPAVAAARWSRLEAVITESVHAEYDRWGNVTPSEWASRMAWMYGTFFPQRTDILLANFQSRGLLPLLDPPTASVTGPVPFGTQVTVSPPGAGTVYLTTDGTDPRLDGGGISPTATTTNTLTITSDTTVNARVLSGSSWSPLAAFELTLTTAAGPAPLLLNEFNAVGSNSYLGGGAAGDLANGTDDTLGRILGNGGDWFELVVIEDQLDIRGWTVEVTDTSSGSPQPSAALTFANTAALSDLRSGTLITVSESLDDDLSFNPAAGDWHINLRSDDQLSGSHITSSTQSNFAINSRDTQIVIRDETGATVALRTGEGTVPAVSVSSIEVFKLEGAPVSSLMNDSALYSDGTSSTWGLPNRFGGGANVQDLSALRFVIGDADCSNTVSLLDARNIAQHAIGQRTLSSACPLTSLTTQTFGPASDVDGDARISLLDARLVGLCAIGVAGHPCS